MRVSNVNDYLKGWFVGPFSPTLNSVSSCECAVKKYKAGDYEPLHHHKVVTEYTVVALGRIKMNGFEYGPDTILEIMPGEAVDFEALTDVITFVVKLPADPTDKYLGAME